MAGKKHHHIWQHIQRGFSTEQFNDHHIWVYRKSSSPERTVTRLHGQEKFFYGHENSVADTKITALENLLSGFISDARTAPSETRLDSKLAGLLVTTLEVRSAFLRSEFSRLLERMLEYTKVHLNSSEVMARWMQAVVRKHPDILELEFDKLGVDRSARGVLSEMFRESIPAQLASRRREIAATLDKLFDPMLPRAFEIAKEGHIRALEGEFSHTERTLAHQAMTFEVRQISSGELILPDTTVAFLMKDRARPLSQKSDIIESIVIPIASSTTIIGFKKQYRARSLGTLNSVLASCSYMSFIAKERSTALQSLTGRIGKNAGVLPDSDIAKIVRALEF